MSLSEKLRQELGRLAPFTHGAAVVEASEGGQQAAACADEHRGLSGLQ